MAGEVLKTTRARKNLLIRQEKSLQASELRQQLAGWPAASASKGWSVGTVRGRRISVNRG